MENRLGQLFTIQGQGCMYSEGYGVLLKRGCAHRAGRLDKSSVKVASSGENGGSGGPVENSLFAINPFVLFIMCTNFMC